MPKVVKFSAKGTNEGEFELDEAVFGARVKEQAVHEAVLMQLANKRRARAKVKGVAEVIGGASKPWRQKGTGRARVGSLRSPLRRGGGVSLGPDGRANYRLRLPRKVRRAALRSVLSSAVAEGRLSVIGDVAYDEPKTKQAVSLLSELAFEGQKVLFVIPERNVAFEKSVHNIPRVKALLWSNLNPHDMLNFERIVMFEGAVGKVVEVLK